MRHPTNQPIKPKIANFDSATAMLRSLASHCRDEDFIALGSFPKWATGFMSGVAEAKLWNAAGLVRILRTSPRS
jgi:hypothetical protein